MGHDLIACRTAHRCEGPARCCTHHRTHADQSINQSINQCYTCRWYMLMCIAPVLPVSPSCTAAPDPTAHPLTGAQHEGHWQWCGAACWAWAVQIQTAQQQQAQQQQQNRRHGFRTVLTNSTHYSLLQRLCQASCSASLIPGLATLVPAASTCRSVHACLCKPLVHCWP
jgi:hypothetical protein